MPGQRARRTDEELTYSRDFVRQLAEIAGASDHYELARAARLSPATVNGYWYGQSVPDGFQLMKMLRAAGVVDQNYKLTLPVALAAASVVHRREGERRE